MSLRLLLLLPAVLAFGAEPFDGAWRFDMQKSELSQTLRKLELANGVFTCGTCVPLIKVNADGSYQKQGGTELYDTLSVKVVDNRTIVLSTQKAGKTMFYEQFVVDPDGQRMTRKGTQQFSSGAPEMTFDNAYARESKGPAGSHAISGTWRQAKTGTYSENALSFTYETVAGELRMKTGYGASFAAKFDGKDYPYKDSPDVHTVALRRTGANSFEEIDKKDGRVVSVSRVTISQDGRTLNMVFEDKLRNQTDKMVATRR